MQPDVSPLRNASDSAKAVDHLREYAEGRRPTGSAPLVEALLVDTEQAAAACGIGRATWFRLKAAGKTPAPVRLAGRVLYRVEDLRLWVSLGCPSRKVFDARRAAVDASGRPR
jgi:predicted DNA-binding transcriptional regulator AlpA